MAIDPEGRLLLVAALGAGMAHELRNVLAAAESSIYLAAKLGDDPIARARHLDSARAQVRTAQGLVDRALAPARSGRGLAETVLVSDLCKQAISTAQVGSHASITSEIAEALEVDADPLLLERAIVNLVENAAGAAGTQPVRIVVAAARKGDAVRIEVSDDGPGIPEAVRARLFEPLVTAREGGTGLGLPLVRAIAEAHGGRAEVDSSESGTRVALVLPSRVAP